MAVNLKKQGGAGLIETIIALVIMSFGIISIGVMQRSSLSNLRYSETHFQLNYLSNEMFEQLTANKAAAIAGQYNIGFDDADPTGNWIADSISAWKNRVRQSLPNGESEITCTTESCDIVLRWSETVLDQSNVQQFRLRSPM